MTGRLHVVLGDQLNQNISSLSDLTKADSVLMMEVRSEASYVPHHPKKIALLFSAMRHFAAELKRKGHTVHYIEYENAKPCRSFTEGVKQTLLDHKGIVVTEPGEWRVLEELLSWEKLFKIPVEIRLDTRFYTSITDFTNWARGKKMLRMENFYRLMRKQTGILMDGAEPCEDIWNTDKENRQALDPDIPIPPPIEFKPDSITKDVLELVEEKFGENFGQLKPFNLAVTRKHALQALDHFIEHALPHFGPFQDAMAEGEYQLFHSGLSPYLNCGLLLPQEICEAAEEAYRTGEVTLQNAEGFIRQILGWREFIRGIYWTFMPDYAERNTLNAKRPLPPLYWGAKTRMHCMRHVIKQTEETATSHHIQRLMVTGNFALVAGLDPKEVCEWYLAVYSDAYEWVELPNTLGMALHGDGGVVGSKPYACSGAYINRMSNYCGQCEYSVSKKTGPDACPFNYLYWNFYLENPELPKHNHRLGMVKRQLEKMTEEKKSAIRESAERFFEEIYAQ